MVNELSLNQTVQGEVGEFNSLEAKDVNLDNVTVGTITSTGDVTIDGNLTIGSADNSYEYVHYGDVTINGKIETDRALVNNNLIVDGTANINYFRRNTSIDDPRIFFYDDVRMTDNLFVVGGMNCRGGISSTEVYVGSYNNQGIFSEDYSLRLIGDRVYTLTRQVEELQAASNPSSNVDDLSTTVQALQTRIGTLESLIGLLTNNNTNDTAIEHRISKLEKAITALKAIHDAKKSVYSIPLDW